MPSPGRIARISLPLSIGVILLQWIAAPLYLTEVAPTSVRALALGACARTAVVVAIAWPLLYAHGERLADLGLGLHAFRSALFRGIVFGLLLQLVTAARIDVHVSASAAPGGAAVAARPLGALFDDPHDAPLWVLTALVGSSGEELERAFVLTRFDRAFGPGGLALAVIVDSVAFAVRHAYLGATAMVYSGVVGLGFALVLLHRRRVADSMVAHAVYDLLFVAANYALHI